MDHLQQVHDPIRSPLNVPFVCATLNFNPYPIAFDDFESIPYQNGCDLHELLEGISDQQTLEQNAPFLQSWLFFGLLVQVLDPIGVTLTRNEFVKTQDDGRLVITTEALPKYLWFWLAVRYHQPRQDIEDHAKLADSCLELANKVTNNLSCRVSSSEQSAAQRVLLSLVILGETLCYARKQIVRYSVGPAVHWEYPPLGIVLLKKSGWCVAEIGSL